MTRLYVMDIGTNSARLMLAEVSGGIVKSKYKLVRTVRTGEGMAGSRMLTNDAIERVTAAVGEFRDIMLAESADTPAYIFATSAVRDAENKDELLSRIKERTGLETEVLSGEREARLAFLGAVGEGSGGVIDLGGGSTEIVTGESGRVTYRKSFNTGIIRTRDMFSGLSEGEAARAAYSFSAGLFSELPGEIKGGGFCAVGGTATTLAAMLQELESYQPERIQGYRVEKKEVGELLKKLLDTPLEKRLLLKGLPKSRAEVITYGAAILLAAMDTLDIESYIARDSDNLEGFVMEKAAEMNLNY